MTVRDLRPGHPEEWSERNQTLRHAGEKRPRDDDATLRDPADYTVVGGPDDQRIYGHNRSDNGHYPWNEFGDPYDVDSLAQQHDRGGYLRRVRP